jgi:hypothetical protein
VRDRQSRTADGGNALPADTSPQLTPGTTGPPAGPEPEPEAQRAPEEPASRLPGLPRLYFPEPVVPAPPERDQHAPPRSDGYEQAPPRPDEHAPGPPPAWQQPPGEPGAGQQPPAPDRPGWRQPLSRPPAGGRPRYAPPRSGRPRPTRPPEKELRQRAIAGLVLGLLSLFALFSMGSNLHRGIYLVGFSVLMGPAACVLGITAMRAARRAGAYRPRWSIAGVILGASAATLAVPVLVLYLIFPGPLAKYMTCFSQAQSASASKACTSQFYQAIQQRLGG